MFSITLQSEVTDPKTFNFDKDEITIGRLSSSDIPLNASNISKQHSRIVFREQRYFIIDRKSTNGTFVNGNRVTVPISLKNGDSIYVGDFILKFEKLEKDAVVTPPAAEESTEVAEKDAPTPPPLPPVTAKTTEQAVVEPTEPVESEEEISEEDYEDKYLEMELFAELRLELYIRAMDFDEFAEPEEFIQYRFDDEEFSESLYKKLETILDEMELVDITDEQKETLLTDVVQELIGYGPLEELLFDDDIDEIFVNGPEILIVRKGPVKEVVSEYFCCEESLFNILVRILQPFNVVLEEDSTIINAVLPELTITGVMHPYSSNGSVLRLLKAPVNHLSLDDLVGNEVLTQEMADYLYLALENNNTICLTASDEYDRTDFLEALGAAVPLSNRIALYNAGTSVLLPHPDLVNLETAVGDVLEAESMVDPEDIIHHANKLAVDRLLLSNLDETTAVPLLMSLNSGMPGAIFTMFGISAKDALSRLSRMLRFGRNFDKDFTEELINSNIDIVLNVRRYKNGSAKLANVMQYNEDLSAFVNMFTFKVESETEEELLGEFKSDDSVE